MLFVFVVDGFFFFKQKTAYEMRISDWSSDVCSSDLWDQANYRDPAPRVDWTKAIAAEPKSPLPTPVIVGSDDEDDDDDAAEDGMPPPAPDTQIGRASCRERVCQYV